MANDNGRNDKGQFVDGRKETEEEKLKRSEALSKSWKNRSDYIGDIKDLNPKIYNSWRAIRFTEKGKKIGNSEEWNNFRTFYNDVVGTYQEGLQFRRKDSSKPFSKDNFMWVQKESVRDITSSIYLEYDGKRLNLKQWSEETGVPYNSIKSRYYKHPEYTVEEQIFGKKKNRNSKPAKDWRDSESGIRSKASKMISAYKCKDKRNGVEHSCDIDIDWMINNIMLKSCIYCGDTKRMGCDRIDNSKGHTKDNVVPCCYECNCARNNNFSFDEMKIIGKAIREVKDARNE